MLYESRNPHGGDIYKEPILIDFSANTNPFGTPQGVIEAVTASLSQMHHYPDPYCRALVRDLSKFEAVPGHWILCGNGAAELIYAYCEAVLPQKAVELAPTFSEYALGLERIGCAVSRYTLHEENAFALDRGFLSFVKEEAPNVIFLCNPNNPTGRTIDQALLKEILLLCREQNIRLFLDECFLDLTENGQSMKPYLEENPQLFLLKAFTKSYGMAGIRLGYGLSSDQKLLQNMAKQTQPWNVSLLAQAAGSAALGEQAFLCKTRETIWEERKWLTDALEELGFWVCPGEANFLFFKGPKDLHTALLEKKITIRNCDNYHGLTAGWYRIAVRQHEENLQLLVAMKPILEKETPWH